LTLDEAITAFRRQAEAGGLVLPDILVLDGRIHRVRVKGGKPGNPDGMYKGFADPPYNILWKNHKTGQGDKLIAGERLTPAQRQAAKAQAEANKAKGDEDMARRRAGAAKQAEAILARSIPLPEGDTTNDYIRAKGVKACPGLYTLRYGQEAGGFTFPPGSVAMPISDAGGTATSLQIISAKVLPGGKWPKHLLAGGRKQGCGFVIEGGTASGKGVPVPSFVNTLLVCEGLATGLSLWMATGCTVLVAVDAGNLLAASQAYREAGRFMGWTWVFCADNDFKADGKANVGVESARAAAEAMGALVIVPQLERDGQPVKCDWNDVHQAAGLAEVERQIATVLSSETTRAEEGSDAPPRPEKTTKDMNIMPSFDAEVTDFQNLTGEPRPDQPQGQPLPDEPHSTSSLPDKTPPVRSVSIEAFLSMEFPPRTNILDPWLPSQGLAMAYAYRGVGKTLFALNVAYAVACGGQYLGWNAPAPTGVLYIDGEMPAVVMQERLAVIVKSTGMTPQAPFELLNQDLLIQGAGMPRIDDGKDQLVIDSIIDSHPGIKLIVVDNISTLTSTKENEADGWLAAQAWALRQRAAGRSVLFVHHSGKNGQQRGTSRREDVLDTVLALRHPADYDPNQGAVFEIHFEKARGIYGDDVKAIEARLMTGENGLSIWTTRTVEESTFARVVRMLQDGMTQSEISAELGIGKSTISKHANRAKSEGLVEQSPPRRKSSATAKVS